MKDVDTELEIEVFKDDFWYQISYFRHNDEYFEIHLDTEGKGVDNMGIYIMDKKDFADSVLAKLNYIMYKFSGNENIAEFEVGENSGVYRISFNEQYEDDYLRVSLYKPDIMDGTGNAEKLVDYFTTYGKYAIEIDSNYV